MLQLLSNNGASSTLDFMQTVLLLCSNCTSFWNIISQHWVDINGQNEQFWEVCCIPVSIHPQGAHRRPNSTNGQHMGLVWGMYEHGFGKNRTITCCSSTLVPKCLPSGSVKGAEVGCLLAMLNMMNSCVFMIGCSLLRDRCQTFPSQCPIRTFHLRAKLDLQL